MSCVLEYQQAVTRRRQEVPHPLPPGPLSIERSRARMPTSVRLSSVATFQHSSQSPLNAETATRRIREAEGAVGPPTGGPHVGPLSTLASLFELRRRPRIGQALDCDSIGTGRDGFDDLRYLSTTSKPAAFCMPPSLGSTSTISRRITRLEDELGVTIFERGSFGIRLTPAGRDVMVQVRRSLDAIENVLFSGKTTGAAKRGRLRLGVRMPPIGQPLQSLLASWRARHPGVVLTLHELNDNEIFAALVGRELDVALVTTHTLRPGAATVPLYRERVVAALPAMHGLASREF